MISIGITGIIGSGKSMLSNIFRSMDYPVYDADKNAKLLMESDQNLKENLIALFGLEIYQNNKLNKELLRKEIFESEENRQCVNSIVHPTVVEDFKKWRMSQNSNMVFIESAILFEAGINKILDHTIFVEAAHDTLVDRICKRDNVAKDIAENKINIQKKNSGRERCDYIFVNDRKHSLIEQANEFIIFNY